MRVVRAIIGSPAGRREEELGRKLGIPLDGIEKTCAETIPTLKHADDTVVLATSAEDLQILLDVLTIWCKKWQITPNALKCECVVFENTGNTSPVLQFAGATLPVRQSVIYLGYQLSHRGTWGEHVDRRLSKAVKWDGVARSMLGKIGGPPVRVAATVREATAETGILYGAEFTGGTGTLLLEPASQQQLDIAKEILGLRKSADNVGALVELGWTGVETKATRARLMFWWRLGRTESTLMRQLEQQAQENKNEPGKPSLYNWWRYTDTLVEHVAERAGLTAPELRAMGREPFKHLIGHILWKKEYEERLNACKASARLDVLVNEMVQLATNDAESNKKRTHWPGAPYLSHVDNKYHARLLAMARLGLLPIEIEEGRWHGIPREARKCRLGCNEIGDMKHFLRECSALCSECVPALDRSGAEKAAASRSLREFVFWRSAARTLECRWRERSKQLRAAATEPQHPADALDEAIAGEVETIAETIAERQPTAHGIVSFRPGSRAQQSNVESVVASNKGVNSKKKSKKPRNGPKK